MSKRKSLPTKLSLTNSDEESVKKSLGEFKTAGESDFEDDNGVFEDDAATELNSETEDTDNPQQLSSQADAKRNQPALNHSADKASSAMLNSLSQQAMKRKHKKFRPSESEENAENFTNNMNNGSNNLSSLMSLAMGNSQSAYDLFALSSMGNNSQQLLSTLARFASANNHQEQQTTAVSKEHHQQTKNNGLFRRRKRSELEEDEDNEPKDEYNDLKATDQTASLLAAISNLQQPQSTANSNEQIPLAQMVGQLAGGRKQPSDSDVKQENERKLLEVLRKCGLMLNQQSEVPNGNSLANGSAFNNLQLDIVSGYSFPFPLGRMLHSTRSARSRCSQFLMLTMTT